MGHGKYYGENRGHTEDSEGQTPMSAKKTARQFAKKLISEQRDIPPEISQTINENFWDLI